MITLEEIYKPIQKGLEKVEDELKQRTNHNFNFFRKGKRLRPALLLFSANAFNNNYSRDLIQAASALEMIHTASLIHDDIVDESLQRRDKPSLYKQIGIKPAVILGDFLFAQGLSMVESIKNSNVMPIIVSAVKTMCEGQWLEFSVNQKNNFTLQDYLRIIEKKTVSLFSCCCEIGGIYRNANKEELSDLYNFAYNFGLGYQLLDDAKDLTNGLYSPLELIILKFGGSKYCEKLALDFLKQATLNISQLSNIIEKTGFKQIIHYTEVKYEQ